MYTHTRTHTHTPAPHILTAPFPVITLCHCVSHANIRGICDYSLVRFYAIIEDYYYYYYNTKFTHATPYAMEREKGGKFSVWLLKKQNEKMPAWT